MALRRGVGSLAGPESSPYRPRTTLEFGPEKSRYSVLLAHQKKPGPIGKKNPISCYSRLPASHSHTVTTHGARPHAPRSHAPSHRAEEARRRARPARLGAFPTSGGVEPRAVSGLPQDQQPRQPPCSRCLRSGCRRCQVVAPRRAVVHPLPSIRPSRLPASPSELR